MEEYVSPGQLNLLGVKLACNVARLIERFMHQRNLRGNMIASQRDTFRLLLMFVKVRLRESRLPPTIAGLDATFIGVFLTDLE